MSRNFKVIGTKELQKALRAKATLDDVKNVVKKHTLGLDAGMKRETQNVLTGHYEGGKFVKPTGQTKRSITSNFSVNGMTGRVGPTTDYSEYLFYGTRFMAKRDFMSKPYKRQKTIFIKDLSALLKKVK